MKKITLALLAMAIVLAIAPSVLAEGISDPTELNTFKAGPLFTPQINGTIGVAFGNDNWTSSTNSPTSGVTFGNLTGTYVDATGDFSHLFLANSTLATVTGPLLFNSPNGFTFTVQSGSEIATFIISSMTVLLDNSDFLNVTGTGTVSLNGYALTPATFNLDSTDSSHHYGASSSTLGIDIATGTAAATPEPGSIILLGTGLIGLAKVGYRKAKASFRVS